MPDAPADDSSIGAAIPVTYVPFRNAHFLSAAVSWAEVLEAKAVFIGAVEQDSSGYPDCRPAYYEAFQQVINTGTRHGNAATRAVIAAPDVSASPVAEDSSAAGAIAIHTPLIQLRKSDIVRLGLELRAPFHVTWSCYSGETTACGTCESCILRLRAFAEAGQDDPIRYATDWKRTPNAQRGEPHV